MSKCKKGLGDGTDVKGALVVGFQRQIMIVEVVLVAGA